MATDAALGDTGHVSDKACKALAGTFSNSVVMAAQRLDSSAKPAGSKYAVWMWSWLTKPAGLESSGSNTTVL